jgi:diguanylate cyclase (GGDEF)-like protein
MAPPTLLDWTNAAAFIILWPRLASPSDKVRGVKLVADPNAVKESLLQLLEQGAPEEEKLLAHLERHEKKGFPLYSSVLSILTHLSFSEAEARRHWRRVVAHRERLRQALGRDVGLRVAILDFFVNVARELKNPKVIEISIYERTERSAVTDGLTGLYNHAYVTQAVRREVQRSKRHELRLSLVLFDLDDFKAVNDRCGHLEGNRVLVKVSKIIQDTLRDIDVAARYGGEEFAVMLPETSRSGAYVVAERIRKRIQDHFRRRRQQLPVTLSGGVATFPDDAQSAEDLLRRADEGLYQAKAEGKNRITLAFGERRRHLRVPTNHAATISAWVGRRAAARVKNVSEGGLLVNLKEPVPLGSKVSLVIRPAGCPPIGLRGDVVRVDEARARGGTSYLIGVRLRTDASQARALLVLRRLEATARG